MNTIDETVTKKMELVRKEALDFLKNNNTCVIATTSKDSPFASTVYYIVDDSFTFYFATQMNTKKYMNLERNGKVAMVIGTGPKHISVNVRGKAELVAGQERTAVFERLLMLMFHGHVKNWPVRDMAKVHKSEMVVFKIMPEEIAFMNFDDENYAASMSDHYLTIMP